MVYLDIAQYLLSGDPTWPNVVIANIDHHSSQLRFSLHAPLGLIASDMKLGHPELLSRMESNLRKSHFFNDSLMCLFCVLQGEPVVKLAQLMRWRQQIDLAPQDVKTLDTLIAGEPISNAAIFGEYSRITRYLVCRLLDPEIAAPSHLRRSNHVQRDLIEDQRFSSLTLQTLWQRLAGHPLMRPSVSLTSEQSASSESAP